SGKNSDMTRLGPGGICCLSLQPMRCAPGSVRARSPMPKPNEAAGGRMMNTIDRARYRWREILPQLGIETAFLQNKHGPCPLCGGRDRFRFDDKDGSGSYYCNQCGAGAGLILVQKKNGWDFKTACDAIDRIIGTAAFVESEDSKPRNDDSKRHAA